MYGIHKPAATVADMRAITNNNNEMCITNWVQNRNSY